MARYLRKNGARIDRVLVSTSARTVQTADLVLRELEMPPRADYRDALYLAEPGKILAMLQAAPARTDAVMVIGHNPGLEELATLLAREPVRRKERERRDVLEEKFPTARAGGAGFRHRPLARHPARRRQAGGFRAAEGFVNLLRVIPGEARPAPREGDPGLKA